MTELRVLRAELDGGKPCEAGRDEILSGEWQGQVSGAWISWT